MTIKEERPPYEITWKEFVAYQEGRYGTDRIIHCTQTARGKIDANFGIFLSQMKPAGETDEITGKVRS